jgi:predicted O-methyltransferase YrrM
MDIDEINNIYINNLNFYKDLKHNISENITGRICHHSVILLNILVNHNNIINYLEIGTHNGTSMSYVVNQNKRQINCYGIDLFEQTIEQYRKDEICLKRTYKNIQKNNISNSHINLIKGNSISVKTYNTLKAKLNKLNKKTIDLLFIDGDHSYAMTKRDFKNYSRFLSDDGLVVFDDYNQKWPGVIKFCKENLSNKNFKPIGLFGNNEWIIKKC